MKIRYGRRETRAEMRIVEVGVIFQELHTRIYRVAARKAWM